MADLAAAVAELDTGQSLSELLVAVRARTKTVKGIATSGSVLSYLASINKLTTLEDIASDAGNPLRNAAKAALITLQYREGLDFTLAETGIMLDAFGPTAGGVFTSTEIDSIKALGESSVLEFPNVREVDVKRVR